MSFFSIMFERQFNEQSFYAYCWCCRYLYWVQGGHNPVIRRAGLDGSEPQTIVSTDVESVHSLSLGEMLLSGFETLSVDEEVAFYKLPNEFQKSDTVYMYYIASVPVALQLVLNLCQMPFGQIL